ncbi:hypothetical protein COE36_25115 [Bacillus cereus]|nr:hypothetical protein COJ34_20470 [Bacillus cereus]PFQ99266.1 hypothetical protein COK32_05210 [Bacillus cereus]PGY81747.1 hypothetical protein COE36_25115 [Bacillus cereus]
MQSFCYQKLLVHTLTFSKSLKRNSFSTGITFIAKKLTIIANMLGVLVQFIGKQLSPIDFDEEMLNSVEREIIKEASYFATHRKN